MTYSTPELLLIGSAQNVVMDGKFSDDPNCQLDPVPLSYDPALW